MQSTIALAEIWRPAPGWEGLYEVSDLGQVRSLPRRGTPGKILTPITLTRGYLGVRLVRNCLTTTVTVHRLVSDAFLGPLPVGKMRLHGPDGKHDNRAANLSFGTALENAADTLRDGTRRQGSRIPWARLTEDSVWECRSRYAAGERISALAADFGVGWSTMKHVVNGSTWTTVPMICFLCCGDPKLRPVCKRCAGTGADPNPGRSK